MGVPLLKKNKMTEAELAELRTDYSISLSVELRLLTLADMVRYPPDGCMLILTDMYKHGLRLPLHPWVQMMLAKLGYAPEQYNLNLWILLHGVYIAWWLAKLGEPTFEQFMYLYSVSMQQGNFGRCRPIAKRRKRGYFISHLPSSQKSWRNRWCLAFGDWECSSGKTVAKHVPSHFQSIGHWSRPSRLFVVLCVFNC